MESCWGKAKNRAYVISANNIDIYVFACCGFFCDEDFNGAACYYHIVTVREVASSIYLPTPFNFKTLPLNLRNFLALEQHRRLLLLLWKKNAALKL